MTKDGWRVIGCFLGGALVGWMVLGAAVWVGSVWLALAGWI
jgi:hypothetical protein